MCCSAILRRRTHIQQKRAGVIHVIGAGDVDLGGQSVAGQEQDDGRDDKYDGQDDPRGANACPGVSDAKRVPTMSVYVLACSLPSQS